MPLMKGVDRLHIVMPVNQHCRAPGGSAPSGINERVSACRDDGDIVKAGPAQLVCQPMRTLPHILGMSGLGADRRKADKFLELRQWPLPKGPGIGESGRGGIVHSRRSKINLKRVPAKG